MTNGEKIEEIFPNLEISPDPYSPSVDICVGGIMMMRVDRNWWNAEYKEPFINKPCVSSGVCEHDKQNVLDKIRAEIMQLDYDIESIDYDYNDMAQTEMIHTICREEVLRIIDKYKTETEDKG